MRLALDRAAKADREASVAVRAGLTEAAHSRHVEAQYHRAAARLHMRAARIQWEHQREHAGDG
jgi:hypothetical protein